MTATMTQASPAGDTHTVLAAAMRGIVQRAYGSSDTLSLAELPGPRPAAGEVLIAVHAAGVDRGAWHLMTGLPYLVRLTGYGLTRGRTRQPRGSTSPAGW